MSSSCHWKLPATTDSRLLHSGQNRESWMSLSVPLQVRDWPIKTQSSVCQVWRKQSLMFAMIEELRWTGLKLAWGILCHHLKIKSLSYKFLWCFYSNKSTNFAVIFQSPFLSTRTVFYTLMKTIKYCFWLFSIVFYFPEYPKTNSSCFFPALDSSNIMSCLEFNYFVTLRVYIFFNM